VRNAIAAEGPTREPDARAPLPLTNAGLDERFDAILSPVGDQPDITGDDLLEVAERLIEVDGGWLSQRAAASR
jgi:hypothetical protein